MNAHIVQFDIAWEDKHANYHRVSAILDHARVGAGDFVLLPEMFDTGFSLNVKATADTDSASRKFLGALAARHHITIQAGITVVNAQGKGLNRAVVYGPAGQLLAEYDKMHPFSFGREGEHFVGGRTVTVFPWRPGDKTKAPLTVCPAVCYDLRFPELFRKGLALGAEVFAIGANWPSSRVAHWRALLIARAIENQAYVLAANRSGSDPNLQYPGDSIVIDPQGSIVAEAGAGEEVLSVEIDPAAIQDWRSTFPAWKDQSSALM